MMTTGYTHNFASAVALLLYLFRNPVQEGIWFHIVQTNRCYNTEYHSMLLGIVVAFIPVEKSKIFIIHWIWWTWRLKDGLLKLMQSSEGYKVCKFDSNLAGLQRFRRIFVKAILCKCQREFFWLNTFLIWHMIKSELLQELAHRIK